MMGKAINRVRCVLARNDRYLLVLHNNRLPEDFGKWGLPGGVLDSGEEPAAGIRRELKEEFEIGIGPVVLVGDWDYQDETHRVFGCEIREPIDFYDTNEILKIAWLTFNDVVGFFEAEKFHTGFELDAITKFRVRQYS